MAPADKANTACVFITHVMKVRYSVCAAHRPPYVSRTTLCKEESAKAALCPIMLAEGNQDCITLVGRLPISQHALSIYQPQDTSKQGP